MFLISSDATPYALCAMQFFFIKSMVTPALKPVNTRLRAIPLAIHWKRLWHVWQHRHKGSVGVDFRITANYTVVNSGYNFI